jgi:hypothetical protein
MTNYRDLSLAGLRPVVIDRSRQSVPQLQWIETRLLVVDPTYQRDIQTKGRRSIQHIAENFDWTKFACIVIAAVEGGRYAIIDGQHRATAALLIGLEKIPAQIVVADQTVQAAAFAAINSKVTRMNQIQVHKALVACGEAEALQIEEVCACADVVIPRSTGGWNFTIAGRTQAVLAIKTSIRLYGRETTITALQCVTQTNNNAPGILRSFVITALCRLLAKSPYWRDAGDKLFEAMDAINLEEIAQNAKALVTRSSDGSAINDFIANLSRELQARLGDPGPIEQVGEVVQLTSAAKRAARGAAR